MTDTNTANLGLLIADLNDTFNFGAHVENNFTTIDGLMGAVQCSSTSRPTNTYAGQIVYETDSKRYAQNTGTKATPAWTYMSHQAYAAASSARPTVGLTAGELLYETDNAMVRPRGGAGWLSNIPTCTSSARPANPVTGDLAAETDTGRVIWWNGAAWQQKAFSNYVCTSGTHPASPFTGLEIYETDTGLNALYNGSSYLYNAQQIAPTQVLTGSAGNVNFTSIPAVGALLLVWSAHSTTTGAVDLEMHIDSATSGYQSAKIQGHGGAVSVVTTATTYLPIGITPGTTADYSSSGFAVINGWSSSSQYLTYSAVSAAFDTSSSYWTETYNGQYTTVGPHSAINLTPAGASFAAGSRFSLYALP